MLEYFFQVGENGVRRRCGSQNGTLIIFLLLLQIVLLKVITMNQVEDASATICEDVVDYIDILTDDDFLHIFSLLSLVDRGHAAQYV